jgi:uncharacterized membrane protein YiaA
MDRLVAIKKSITAFVCGILACIPVLGLIPAICAWSLSRKVRRNYHDWNPAEGYLKWARILAIIGVLLTTLAVGVAALAIASQNGNSFYYSDYSE